MGEIAEKLAPIFGKKAEPLQLISILPHLAAGEIFTIEQRWQCQQQAFELVRADKRSM